MAENTIEKIQEKVRNYNSLNEENKAELLDLLAKLNNEIAELSKEHAEHAETIAGHIERSTDEAMKDEKDPNLLKKAIEGLSDSVKGFEVSHPILTENVNYIATVLSNMGI
jgi:hypothetical protein